MSQYLRDRWGTENGFPRGPIYAIGQTTDGYLWIGTGAGLVRFDGVSFRAVNDNRGAFQIASVPELAGDSDGCLWLRLQDLTLLRYCSGAFRVPGTDADRHSRVSAMSRTSRGEILVAEPQGSAQVFREGGFRTLASAGGLSRTPLTALAQTQNGDIWMGTRDTGIFRFTEGSTVRATHGLPGAKINCLLADGNHSLWIGTDEGIEHWNGSEFDSAGIPASLGHFQVLSMARDRDRNLWLGTDSRGLLRLNSQGVAVMNDSDAPSRGAVTAVFEDREGNLWIGSARGLERIRDSTFVTYSPAQGLPTDGNNPVFVDSEARMWFPPVDGGLWWVKDGQHGHVAAGGLEKDVVYSIAGRNGELWLGRQHGGLTRLRSGNGVFTAKTYTQADGLAQNSVFSVYQARDGAVWAGTVSGGVSRLADGVIATYTVSDGLASNTVLSILESRDGVMWFATPSGLSARSNGHWQTYAKRDGLPASSVNCLQEDTSGVLWVGTAAGLAFDDAGRFRAPANVPPVLQDQILGLAEDKFGWLWISTSSHVLRVRRDKLRNGGLVDNDVREFGLADGLRGIEGVKRHQSVITDSLGRIWFSLNRGISSVDPALLERPSAPAIVHLLSLSADNSAVGLAGSVHIPGGRKRVTFGFAALSLSAPDQVRFRYRLDPYDPGWSEASASPEASYTNLSPGQYRFRVIASNPSGVWSNEEAALSLRVDPLYWQTWWFAVIVVVACASAAVAIHRMRLRQITRQLNIRFDERLAERTRLARELHDTLLQTIQGSKMVADDGLDDPADPTRAYRALERVSKWLSQAAQEGRAALAALRASTTERNDLAQAFARAGEDCIFRNSLKFALTVEGAARDMHPIVRDEVYRIGYEAIRNACQHSQGTRLDVELRYSRDLAVRVRDNGVGIAQEAIVRGKAGHYGVKGMQERAEHIGARLHFTSTDSGTEVELIVPGSLTYRDETAGQGLLRRLRRLLRWGG